MTFTEDFYLNSIEKLSSLSDDELIHSFNKEVGNLGWTSTRGAYLSALNDAISQRNFKGTPLIIKGGRMSIKRHISLRNNQLELV
ncbi:hypothetical protein [Flammeovirga agarivorans]|uniref:Uncharacterized protein n=1 Tax=Flammeovirga agarivorans TaxID=2726742 RepID=A0A7X8XY59_9BACT|nr:hypothetical protein [Flammeovirga agarivorans]NLR93740.1 hypothetical protein [Flammeovirga agarivorans]